jgi:hypothetical protein
VGGRGIEDSDAHTDVLGSENSIGDRENWLIYCDSRKIAKSLTIIRATAVN